MVSEMTLGNMEEHLTQQAGRALALDSERQLGLGCGARTDVPPRFRRFSPENSRITYFMA